jgi:uncharacterized membrane protein (DUF485 family)
MSSKRLLAPALVVLIALACTAFYSTVAFAPRLLDGRAAGLPLALVVALVLFVGFFAATVIYMLAARDDAEGAR